MCAARVLPGAAATFVLLALLAPPSARAYTYQSPLASGCHESMTIAALRRVRADGAPAMLATTHDDRLWIDDLPLELPDDARDLAAASLLVGVRDNDLKGRHGLDTSQLALVHGNPAAQIEHCLRRPEHDEPDGSAAALAECRAYLHAKVEDALRHGLDARGRPDPDARMAVDVDLVFANEVRVPMPLSYVQLGRALHTLQDSFSHALRSEDGLRVRGLLNWIDVVAEHHDVARDGPAHRAGMDECEDLDAPRALRLQRAIDASAELLAAALDPAGDVDERLATVDAVLDRYMSFEPGCGAGNDFCDAPELEYAESETGCSAAAGQSGSSWPAYACALVACAVCRRRRAGAPRGNSPTGVTRRAVLVVAVVGSVACGVASAQPSPALLRAPPQAEPAPAFALAAELGGAIDQASAAGAVGARYFASERWLFGVDVEWNPWFSLGTGRVRPGTFNAYASAIWRAPMTADAALRVGAHAGAALLLFDLYGAPSGSVGPYLGLSLLALELAVSQRLRVIFEPADVVVAMPHVTGIPLTRRQYRASVGLELQL